jgi:hypothetical protein
MLPCDSAFAECNLGDRPGRDDPGLCGSLHGERARPTRPLSAGGNPNHYLKANRTARPLKPVRLQFLESQRGRS